MGTICTALLTTVGTSFLILEGPAGSCVTTGSVVSLVEPAGSYVAAGSVLTAKWEGGGTVPGSGT